MTRFLVQIGCTLAAVACFTTPLQAEPIGVDLAGFLPGHGTSVRHDEAELRLAWSLPNAEIGSLVLNLRPDEPLIKALSIHTAGNKSAALLTDASPVTYLTVGERKLQPHGWTVFFDNPPRRPHETFRALRKSKGVKVQTAGRKTSLVLDGLSAGGFRGELWLSVYAGCRLVHVEAVLSTGEDARAILYDAGLASDEPSWKSIVRIDTSDTLQRVAARSQPEAAPVAARYRAIVAESEAGSVAIFPPPHQYLYPLDFSDNFRFVWHGQGFHRQGSEWGFGVRQPPEGDGRFVPWINAPPGTEQRLGVFYLLSRGGADKTIDEVKAFTHGDRYVPLEGHKTFSSHYHVEHTLDFLRKQKEQQTDGVPRGLEEPPFVKTFKRHGVQIVHLAEFHVHHSPEFIAQRIEQLQTMHRECRRLSDDEFLLLPGEEPNVHLGGHWISFFPRPVHWLLHPEPGEPFDRQVEGVGTVYAVHSAADVLRLMEKERGLMWTAHPRIKSSFDYPDRYRQQDFYRSDRFLGAAWKAMPADLSQPKLGLRCLDLLDDMANWGQQKYVLGEVDVFKVDPSHELYGHMNINYLRLDKLPRFDDGWQSVCDALRGGRFFVSTGEVLMPEFTAGGQPSGETIERAADGRVEVKARLTWTFPPAFAEVIWGDGEQVQRHRIDLKDHPAFGEMDLQATVDAKNANWIRLEAWDIAANGAFSQPVWIE
ncbi:MAG: hypothetical protein WD872_00185 [Pirellulaceae bacterium]